MKHSFSVLDALHWKEVHNPLAGNNRPDRQSTFPRELSSPLELGDCLFTGPRFAHRAPSIETLATLNGVLGTETWPRAKYLDINDGKRSYRGNPAANAGGHCTIELHRMFRCVPTRARSLDDFAVCFVRSVKKGTLWPCEQVWDHSSTHRTLLENSEGI